MGPIQLSFHIRTSANAKTVHLLGSWDNYKGQLPLSKDGSKKGAWKGAFKFQDFVVKAGSRYWYYYIIDGYQVSHNPTEPSTKEPTTKRTLNVLDVAPDKHSGSSSKRRTVDLPHKGRPLSMSKIEHPRPEKPYQTKHLYTDDYEDNPELEELTSRFSSATLIAEDEYFSASSPSSVGSSISSRSGSSSPESLSSISDYSSPGSPVCKCERYGITRKGDRVKIDCGGSRCGYSDEGSSCSSDSNDSDSELGRSPPPKGLLAKGLAAKGGGPKVVTVAPGRRNGIVVRR